MNNRIIVMENKLKSDVNLFSAPDDIMAEFTERKRNESKVIALNIPESKKTTGIDRLKDDRNELVAIIPPELSHTLANIKLRRLGRAADGRTRPLLLDFPSVNEAKTLLKTGNNGASNTIFKNYLTQSQQIHLKTVRLELKSLEERGITNKTIKYVSGIPKIVNKHTFPTPNGRRNEN